MGGGGGGGVTLPTPRKYILIGITRSKKRRRKQFAMLTSQQNVQRIVFMQISAAIIEKSIFHYILANVTDT